ncbi:Fatty acid desaturase 2 [Orchesella cincta]|uniref:Fatty acid desaturase 2 n=1 Tax=Orchesella cincta TaxID=48709 RepID=A0A1D2M7R2_ORCCI|nr:Fatty acid desaturase 2 [Orchesella cincta]
MACRFLFPVTLLVNKIVSMGNKIWDDKNGPDVETKEIFYDGHYYNVTEFIKRHPGAEDATVPIQQFHSRSIAKVHGIMKSLPCRPQTDADLLGISIYHVFMKRERNKALTEDFTKLFLELQADGLFEPSYFHVAHRILELFVLGAVGFYLTTQANSIIANGIGCIFLFFAQLRALGVMHEGGHLSLTGNPKVDRLLQTFTLGPFVGISPTYWRRYHSFHHAQTARVKYDLDFETIPLLLLNMKVLDDPKKQQNFIMRNQIFFAPFTVIVFVVYLQTWEVARSLIKCRLPSELLAIGIYHILAWHIGFWQMLVVIFLTGNWYAINVAINHTHLPVSTEPSHWVEQSLLHTVNIKHSPWIDWWMCLLDYQIEHHLFPTMPQFSNRLAVDRVKAFAKKHGLPYQVLSYKEAVMRVIANVYNVSNELKKIHNE